MRGRAQSASSPGEDRAEADCNPYARNATVLRCSGRMKKAPALPCRGLPRPENVRELTSSRQAYRLQLAQRQPWVLQQAWQRQPVQRERPDQQPWELQPVWQQRREQPERQLAPQRPERQPWELRQAWRQQQALPRLEQQPWGLRQAWRQQQALSRLEQQPWGLRQAWRHRPAWQEPRQQERPAALPAWHLEQRQAMPQPQ